MRLAVFTNAFPGHVNTFFARDVRSLIDAGMDVDVFPLYPYDPANWRLVPELLNSSVLDRDGVFHVSFPRDLRRVFPREWRQARIALSDAVQTTAAAARYGPAAAAKNIYCAAKACAWARSIVHSYDHVLAYWGNYSATSAYMFDRLLDKRLPFTMFLHSALDLYTFRPFLRQKLIYADNIVVVCRWNEQVLKESYSDLFPALSSKIHVHYLGLDLDEYRYEPHGHSERTLLGVGGLDRVKGFDYLICAAAELRRAGKPVEVELVGDGPESGALKQLATRLGILEHVKFSGWLSPEDTRRAMRNATILVLPSRGDAFPTVLKEAMAIGTPAVASAVNGIPELLDHGRCGVLVPPGNVPLLVNAISRLLDEPGWRAQYAQAARQRAEADFDQTRNGRRLAELIASGRRFEAPESEAVRTFRSIA